MHTILVLLFALLATKVNLSVQLKDTDTTGSPESEASKFRDSFDKINEFLIENVNEDDPEANLEAAMKRLTDEVKSNGESELVQALRLFISMGTVTKEDNCNLENVKTLMKIDEATGGQAPEKASKKVDNPRRIDKVIDFYVKKFENSCSSVTKSGVMKSGRQNQPSYQPGYNQPPVNYGGHNPSYQPNGYPADKPDGSKGIRKLILFGIFVKLMNKRAVKKAEKKARRREEKLRKQQYNQQYNHHGG